MYQGTTFTFSQPFCECQELRMSWGLSMSNGAPCMAFQCQTCLTVMTVPLPKLKAGFDFGYLPPGVKVFVGGEEQNKDVPSGELKQEDGEFNQEDNVIVGPWAGSELPPNQQEGEE